MASPSPSNGDSTITPVRDNRRIFPAHDAQDRGFGVDGTVAAESADSAPILRFAGRCPRWRVYPLNRRRRSAKLDVVKRSDGTFICHKSIQGGHVLVEGEATWSLTMN